MKTLHWRDRNGNEGHGEPTEDRVCDVNVDYLNVKYRDEIYHWAEEVPEQNNSEDTMKAGDVVNITDLMTNTRKWYVSHTMEMMTNEL